MREIKSALETLLDKKQDAVTAYPAKLGNGSGKVTAGPGVVYVRMENIVNVAICTSVPPIHDLDVWVGYDPLHPSILSVLGQRNIPGRQDTAPGVAAHAAMHEFLGAGSLGGTDVVKVQLQQFMPLAVWPYGGMKVIIWPGIAWINGEYKVIADTNQRGKPVPKIIDFGEYPGPSIGKEMYYLIGIDNTGNLQVVGGDQVDKGGLLLTDIPATPDDMLYPLAAVRRTHAQMGFVINRESTDIVDLRYPLAHKHQAGDIGTGELDADRLPLFTTTKRGAVPAPGTVDGKVLRDDGTWAAAAGDMTKAVYDTDDDGVVDAAESVDWSGVSGKPAAYPPESHNHNASDINSGTLSTDRYSAYADLQAEDRIKQVTTNLITANAWRTGELYTITEDFTSTSPSGFSWAGSPFETPSTTILVNSRMRCIFTSNKKGFLYKTIGGSSSQILGIMGFRLWRGDYCGTRMDDGSDNNYLELVWERETDDTYSVRTHYRSGGGAVTSTQLINLKYPPAPAILVQTIYGTKWSNWGSYGLLCDMYNSYILSQNAGLSWTCSRVGLVMSLVDNNNYAVLDAWGEE